MKITRLAPAAALLAVGALTLSACGGSNGGSNGGGEGGEGGDSGSIAGTLIGGGASSQESAMTAWVEGVKSEHADLTVQYDPVGSGSGREGFLNGQYSFAGSDAAMDDDEKSQAESICGPEGVFQVPAYISPVAVAYNLPEVSEAVKMDADTIAKVFTGEISKWNDEAIASQNEGVELPDMDITVVHRADDSGTTENFTEYLAAAAPDSWTHDVVEAWPSDIAAESAQQTSGVVSLTNSTEGAITYADASQVGELGTVAVGVGEEYVEYSADAAAQAVESAEQAEDGSVELDRDTEEAGVYPIVLVSYHIYCKQYQDQETADLAKAFATYVVSEAGQSEAEGAAGSAPISAGTRDAAMQSIDAIGVQG
ncbi:phosphate ABC transporter substrate-binding protein PstS [Brevibacterium sp. R8603A2]|uniref:phosphate ABC transporter substrate-binding protein PstS n=1 Tax=Brevibacterium sp. R8603A2 TaxID=2929779 RepID=UPI001FF8A0EC|nr:phosphate ABC transporter substrate-binding protein PstS [Brevibacterium sp. R8603A2]